jgi:hypothetical protein
VGGTAEQEAAVSAGRTGGDRSGIDTDDVQSPTDEFADRGQPGTPEADDANVACHRTVEDRKALCERQFWVAVPPDGIISRVNGSRHG